MVVSFNTVVMSRLVLGSASKSGNRTSQLSNKKTGVRIGVYPLKTAITPVKSVLVDSWGATNQESFTCLVCHTASRSNAMQRVTASAFTEDSKCPRAIEVPVYYPD